MRWTLVFLVTLVFGPAAAQDWNVRPWDTSLDRGEIQTRVIGQDIRFPDGAVAQYRADGTYSYIYNGGNRFDGVYEVMPDSSICVTFANGRDRCDLYVLQGDQLMLINEQGGRFLTE